MGSPIRGPFGPPNKPSGSREPSNLRGEKSDDFKKRLEGKKEEQQRKKASEKEQEPKETATDQKSLSDKASKEVSATRAEKLNATEVSTTMKAYAEKIQSMVSQMLVDKTGKNLEMTLKAGIDTPEMFEGAKISLTLENGALALTMDIPDADNLEKILNLMQSNQAQLQHLSERLTEKNIQLTSMNINGITIPIPEIEAKEKTTQTTQSELPEEKKEDQQQDQQEEEK